MIAKKMAKYVAGSSVTRAMFEIRHVFRAEEHYYDSGGGRRAEYYFEDFD